MNIVIPDGTFVELQMPNGNEYYSPPQYQSCSDTNAQNYMIMMPVDMAGQYCAQPQQYSPSQNMLMPQQTNYFAQSLPQAMQPQMMQCDAQLVSQGMPMQGLQQVPKRMQLPVDGFQTLPAKYDFNRAKRASAMDSLSVRKKIGPRRKGVPCDSIIRAPPPKHQMPVLGSGFYKVEQVAKRVSKLEADPLNAAATTNTPVRKCGIPGEDIILIAAKGSHMANQSKESKLGESKWKTERKSKRKSRKSKTKTGDKKSRKKSTKPKSKGGKKSTKPKSKGGRKSKKSTKVKETGDMMSPRKSKKTKKSRKSKRRSTELKSKK